MKTIKIWYPKQFSSNLSKDSFWFLKDEFSFIYEEDSPDYLIAPYSVSVNIECYKIFFEKKIRNSNAICIGFTTEAIYPDLNIFDYAICFDRSYIFSDRISTIPLLDSFYYPDISLLSNQRDISNDILKEKEGFCSFIYSNGKAHHRRDELFFSLSKYSKVNSLGSHLNNTKIENTRTSSNWFQISVDIKKRYKFSIAAENGQFSGYTTEKLCSSYLAHSVPVYWGNELIEEIVNPKAIINANNLSNDELLKKVKQINENDDLWCEMVSQPLFTKEQTEYHLFELNRYQNWFKHIFEQTLIESKRVNTDDVVLSYIKQILKN